MVSKLVIHDNISSGFAAEALACLQAVMVGKELGIKICYFRRRLSDSYKKREHKKKEDKSIIGLYIDDIQEQKANYYGCKFQHAKRTAHNLASEGLKNEGECILCS